MASLPSVAVLLLGGEQDYLKISGPRDLEIPAHPVLRSKPVFDYAAAVKPNSAAGCVVDLTEVGRQRDDAVGLLLQRGVDLCRALDIERDDRIVGVRS